jgi:hypothetical protein
MVAILAAQSVVLALVVVLVAGLLRSHADILRRLPPENARRRQPDPAQELSALELAQPPDSNAAADAAPDIAGTTPTGNAMQVGFRPGGTSTLLAFLSSGCLTCEGFWTALAGDERAALPPNTRVVAITKGQEYESRSKIAALSPKGIPVVMSTQAWETYEVPVAPYFVYVDGRSGDVHGEGAASQWDQLVSLVSDAVADAAMSSQPSASDHIEVSGLSDSHPDRIRRADAELRAAGIAEGHSSLWGGDPNGG